MTLATILLLILLMLFGNVAAELLAVAVINLIDNRRHRPTNSTTEAADEPAVWALAPMLLTRNWPDDYPVRYWPQPQWCTACGEPVPPVRSWDETLCPDCVVLPPVDTKGPNGGHQS